MSAALQTRDLDSTEFNFLSVDTYKLDGFTSVVLPSDFSVSIRKAVNGRVLPLNGRTGVLVLRVKTSCFKRRPMIIDLIDHVVKLIAQLRGNIHRDTK